MTDYCLGLGTTVHPEDCLGSLTYPTYLVKVADKTWYRTEGVPHQQSTSLLGCGTIVFRAQEHTEPPGLLRILKSGWQEDGQLSESALYEQLGKPEGPFQFPRGLAQWVTGGDVHLPSGRAVSIEDHQLQFGLMVIGHGATVH